MHSFLIVKEKTDFEHLILDGRIILKWIVTYDVAEVVFTNLFQMLATVFSAL
jgi:hypothetical protein